MLKEKNMLIQYQYSGVYPYTYNFLSQKLGSEIQCYLCGIWISEKKVTKDHSYPKCRGGVIKAPSCSECNTIKDSLLPIEFALWYSSLGLAFGGMEQPNDD